MVVNAFTGVAKTATGRAPADLLSGDFLDLGEEMERQVDTEGNSPERVASEIFGRSSADPEKGNPA